MPADEDGQSFSGTIIGATEHFPPCPVRTPVLGHDRAYPPGVALAVSIRCTHVQGAVSLDVVEVAAVSRPAAVPCCNSASLGPVVDVVGSPAQL